MDSVIKMTVEFWEDRGARIIHVGRDHVQLEYKGTLLQHNPIDVDGANRLAEVTLGNPRVVYEK